MVLANQMAHVSFLLWTLFSNVYDASGDMCLRVEAAQASPCSIDMPVLFGKPQC